MQSEGRIAGSGESNMAPWEPERLLREIGRHEARYGRGFLTAPLNAWFSGTVDFWTPLFHSLSVDFSISSVERGFSLPEELEEPFGILAADEAAIISFDQGGFRRIAEQVVPGVGGTEAGIVGEYIIRRLLSSLSRTWQGAEALPFYYRGPIRENSVEVAGSLILHASMSGVPLVVRFGFGSQLLERLDSLWRRKLVAARQGEGGNPFTDNIHRVSVDLTEMAVPPALLIDYMRAGTIIDLEVPLTNNVILSVDGSPWAQGEMCRYAGNLAVRVSDTKPVSKEFPESTTRVRVELGSADLDEEGLVEHSQVGAVLVTDTPVTPHASLVISGETVANAAIGEIGGNFALNVIPK